MQLCWLLQYLLWVTLFARFIFIYSPLINNFFFVLLDHLLSFFCPLLVVWRNRCCLTPGPRGRGVPPGWSHHTWGDGQQTFTWGSQPRGIEAPPVCCIMWLWSVSFGYLTSATQAAKVLPSSWFLRKQRCWNSGVELSKSEWRHESTRGKVSLTISDGHERPYWTYRTSIGHISHPAILAPYSYSGWNFTCYGHLNMHQNE